MRAGDFDRVTRRIALEPTSSITRSLADLRGFAFDLDGTIWEGPRLLPGRADLVADLRTAGIGVVFASNCSRYGSGPLARRLEELGIDATATEVLTPFDLVGEEIRRRLGPVPVLVLGTDDLATVLRASGHRPVPAERWQEAQAVVVGVDPDFSYDRLRAAARAVGAGAVFFAINLDARFPVGPEPVRSRLRGAGRGHRRGRRSPADRDRQAGTHIVSDRDRPSGLLTPTGGDGRRQHRLRHRGRPRRRNVHDLAQPRS